ncbi:MAG: DUF262 domain-containing protein [Dehalococcoidia bacterium]|nr:MAG: DUF262 domain-containing protein [Dehalococcoidia bacterium]
MKQNQDDKVSEGLREKSEEETFPIKYSITSYGADYPVDGLVKRIKNGSIFIPPFQRGFVWDLKKASRFIESLLLGLPVPGIFLSKDEETQKLLVIDGQQRLLTLQYFYDGIFHKTGREFALKDIESDYEGTTYKSLPEEDRRRLDDSIIHATIVKQDEPSEDNSSVFHIFERLNTGGALLHPQEIRTAMYQGEFNDLIEQLNENSSWRGLYGPVSSRMRDRELILRFLALYFRGDKYTKPMKEFLNKYMASNRHLQRQSADQIRKVFFGSVETISKHIGSTAFRTKATLIAAVYDATMVGIARRLAWGSIHDFEELQKRYADLLKDQRFMAATTTHTSDENNVANRIALATDAFADVK